MSLLARPSAPRELKVVEVTRDTVQLTWEAPEDDGGSPVTGYVIEKRDISRKAWAKVSFPFSVFFNIALISYTFSIYSTVLSFFGEDSRNKLEHTFFSGYG